jgi:hypothetical protein
MASAVVLLIVIAAAGAWLFRGQAKTRWARQQALPVIARLAQKEQYSAALVLAREAECYIRGDLALSKAWFEISREVSIETTRWSPT